MLLLNRYHLDTSILATKEIFIIVADTWSSEVCTESYTWTLFPTLAVAATIQWLPLT